MRSQGWCGTSWACNGSLGGRNWWIHFASSCSLWCLLPAWVNTDADEHSVGLLWQIGGLGEASLDTPPGGRTEWQCKGPSGAVPHLLRASLWSPSMPWPSGEYASFGVAIPAEWAGTPCLRWGLSLLFPLVWLSRSCWRQCNQLSYPVWFPQKLVRGICSVHQQAACPSLACT